MDRAAPFVPSPSSRGGQLYAGRALLLATAWITGAVPASLGLQRCPSAMWLHVACPGCGMTRAMRLFFAGDVAGSFAMHPLAVPVVAATVACAAGTVLATLVRGTPTALVESRPGRWALGFFVATQLASVALWLLRMAGLFGGPVPV